MGWQPVPYVIRTAVQKHRKTRKPEDDVFICTRMTPPYNKSSWIGNTRERACAHQVVCTCGRCGVFKKPNCPPPVFSSPSWLITADSSLRRAPACCSSNKNVSWLGWGSMRGSRISYTSKYIRSTVLRTTQPNIFRALLMLAYPYFFFSSLFRFRLDIVCFHLVFLLWALRSLLGFGFCYSFSIQYILYSHMYE